MAGVPPTGCATARLVFYDWLLISLATPALLLVLVGALGLLLVCLGRDRHATAMRRGSGALLILTILMSVLGSFALMPIQGMLIQGMLIQG